MTITLKTLLGDAIQPFIPDLARLRIKIFREYPYLYEGDLEYEKNYLKEFSEAKNNMLVVVFDNKKIIGAATGLPLEWAHKEFKEPFSKQQEKISRYFYLGEFILEKPYRNKGLGKQLFEKCETHAKNLTDIETVCFSTVERPITDKRRPENYKPIDNFALKHGYIKQPVFSTKLAWKEIGEDTESLKPMIFWTKSLI